MPDTHSGRKKKIKNCISGRLDGADVMVFEYEYTVGGGKGGSSTSKQTVACFRSNKLILPAFELKQKTLFHKIGGMLGYQSIDFSSHSDFSKVFLLRGNDEASIRNVFSTNVLAYFERHKDLSKDLSVEGREDTLICYRAGERVRPTDIKRFLDEGRAVADLFLS